MSSEPLSAVVAGDDDRVAPVGSRAPRLLIFDVNETLSDLTPMAGRFEDVGAPAHLASSWFAGVLRDGFALTAVESSDSFAHVAAESLPVSLHGHTLNRDVDAATSYILAGFAELPVHADVVDGIRALSELELRLVTLSNGATSVAEGLLERADVAQHFERLLSVEDAGHWKPDPRAYAYALEQCEVDASDAMLVAVHPWDIDGAARAGLATAWISRDGGPYPGHFMAADLRAASVKGLADQLR